MQQEGFRKTQESIYEEKPDDKIEEKEEAVSERREETKRSNNLVVSLMPVLGTERICGYIKYLNRKQLTLAKANFDKTFQFNL